MKYTARLKNIIYFYFFMITASCFAMEKEIPCSTIEKITPFQINYILPDYHTYLSKQYIYNYEGIPSITNLKTNHTTPIEGLNDNPIPFVHIKNTTIIFKDNNTAKIYDVKKNKIIQSLTSSGDKLLSIIHNPFDNSILLLSHNAYEQYFANAFTLTKENSYHESFFPYNIQNDTVFIFHPKASCLFTIQTTGVMQEYKYDNISIIPIHKRHNYALNLPPLLGYRISPDGLIAITNNQGTIISIIYLDILHNKNSTQYVVSHINNKENEYFLNTLFYPKGSILTVMSRNRYNQKTFIRYWDVIKKEYIVTVELPSVFFFGHFYFSRFGKRIILPYQNQSNASETTQSFVSIVPFKIRYKCDTKEKFLWLSAVLNQIGLNQKILENQAIPQDIINYIKQLYLKLFKR